MAATVDIQEANGVTPTLTTITAGRYCTSDAFNPGAANPIPIPAAGFNYSYWKSHCLHIVSGLGTSIGNIKWYSSGDPSWTLGTVGEVRIGMRDTGDVGCPPASYDEASGTPGTTGDDLEASHTYYSGQTNKSDPVSDHPVGTPVDLDSSVYTANDDRSYYAVTQVKVDDDATSGEKADTTFYFRYDEV